MHTLDLAVVVSGKSTSMLCTLCTHASKVTYMPHVCVCVCVCVCVNTEPGTSFKAVDAREKEKEAARARAEALDWQVGAVIHIHTSIHTYRATHSHTAAGLHVVESFTCYV